MFLYIDKNSKCINKNILFSIALFFSIVLILFSGCISFCSLSTDEDKECISYTEALSLCEELTDPIKNYPICSNFSKVTSLDKLNVSSCDSDFKTISDIPQYNNLSLNTEQFAKYFRDNLISSWKESDKLAYSFYEVNKSCDTFLKNGFINSKEQLKTVARDFDYYNNTTMYYFLGLIYSAKKDLKDSNVELMQDTLLYKDYIELSNILNEFQKALGKDFDVKESLAKETLYFYEKYYSNSESRVSLINAISSLNNNDYITKSDFVGWSVVLLAGPIGGLADTSIAISDLITGIEKSNKQANHLSNLLENASQLTNLSEWNKLNLIRDLLNDFYYAHGPNSLSDKSLFELLNNIDSHLSNSAKNNAAEIKELKIKLDLLSSELLKKIQDKSKYSSLYEKYNIVESPYNLEEKLNSFKLKLNNLVNLSLGETHHKLIILNSKFDELKIEINNYLNTDYKSLIALCTSDLMNFKTSINSLNNSDTKILLQNYLDLFFNSKEESTKLTYCSRILSLYSDNNTGSCLQKLKNLNSNLNLNLDLDISEANCEQIIYSQLSEAKNTERYNLITRMYSEYNQFAETISKLKNYNCVSNNDLLNSLENSSYFNRVSKYSNNNALNSLLYYSYSELYSNLSNYIIKQKEIINLGLKCYFEDNYEIDYENNKLILDNIFGELDAKFNLELSNYGISEIINNGCLDNSKINNENLILSFSCLSDNMVYDVISKLEDKKENILEFNIDYLKGNLIEKVCLPQVLKTEYIFDLPIDESYILSYYVSNNYNLESKIIDSKLRVLFPKLSLKEQCININYILNSPFNIETNLSTISSQNNYSNIYYSLNLESNMDILIPKLNFLFSDLNIDQEVYYNNKKQNLINGKYFIELNNFLPKEKRTINYYLRVSNIESLFKYQLEGIYANIQKLKEYSFVAESKINKLVQELERVSNITNESEKSKAISVLKKEVDSLLSDASSNYTYLSRYNLALQNANNLLDQYSKAKSELEKEYLLKSNDFDLTILNDQKTQAEKLFSEGNIKDAVKIIEAFKIDSELEKNIRYLFDSSQKELKELQKQAKKLNIIENSKVFEDLGFRFTQMLNTNKYFDSLQILKEFDIEKNNFKILIDKEILTFKKEILNSKSKYSEYKKKLDNLWARYSFFEQDFDSDKYNLVKNFGVSFSFSQNSLTSLKTKMTNVTKDIVELDKLMNNLDLNDFDIIYNFNNKKYLDFFSEIDSLSESLDGYQKELKSKANNELVLAANSLGQNTNQEFFKAKNAYDENNFVNSIYFSKVALLGLSSGTNDNLGLYLGIGFIVLLAIVVLLFSNKLKLKFNLNSNKNKREKEVSKETYYSVEKED